MSGALYPAAEEEDHLSWCEERLRELHARLSVLNPLYATSFAMGGDRAPWDRVSLGFAHATEDRVVAHLEDHQRTLPEDDHRSRAIIEQMRVDEAEHGEAALDLGGTPFRRPSGPHGSVLQAHDGDHLPALGQGRPFERGGW